jgi:hypothetical protein
MLEWELERTLKEGKTTEKMEGWPHVVSSMNYYGLREEDKCDKDMSRNLVYGEGNPPYNGQTLDKLMLKYVTKQTTSKLHV